MCGIAGKIANERAVDDALLERMCELLEHRGPDARGIHSADGVGLGIQRLAVIDLVRGDQPIYNEDRSIVVILNGEIYNYQELREDLRAARTPVSNRDGHGDDCPPLRRTGTSVRSRAPWNVRVRDLGRAPA